MNRKIIQRDIAGNKAVSFLTVLFITAAAMLLSLAGILVTNLFGSIDRLMADAKTPHFMQMHTGDVDFEELEAFAAGNSAVEDFQVLEFLNVGGEKIRLGENSLALSVQDNGFSVQSSRFDFLLDENNRPAQPKDGELWVPVCYNRDHTVQAGDKAVINGKTFVVTGFVRDSQMNSTLASSKRFVVSAGDYAQLKEVGSVEYLIEFRLKDLSDLSEFESAYSASQMPANGPTLSWPLFRMISAVSDGIMIAVILLVSVIVILIALLCIRFTLLAKIEDDYREIGVMKAVGIRVSDIQSIYLAVYAVLAAAGCIMGFLLSLTLRGPLQESIRANLGESGNDGLSFLLGMAGTLLLFFFYPFLHQTDPEKIPQDITGAGDPPGKRTGKCPRRKKPQAFKEQMVKRQPVSGCERYSCAEASLSNHVVCDHSGVFYHGGASESVSHDLGQQFCHLSGCGAL